MGIKIISILYSFRYSKLSKLPPKLVKVINVSIFLLTIEHAETSQTSTTLSVRLADGTIRSLLSYLSESWADSLTLVQICCIQGGEIFLHV